MKKRKRNHLYSFGSDLLKDIKENKQDVIGVGLESIAGGLNNIYNQNHNQFMNEQQTLQDDYKNLLASREAYNQSALAIQQNRANANPNTFDAGGLLSAGLSLDSAMGKVIGGDYSSGVGNVVSSIPGLGLVGGVINRLTGIKTNQAELNRVKGEQNQLNNLTSSMGAATSFDDISLNGPSGINTNVNAYEGGLFSKGKARRKNEVLRQNLVDTLALAQRSSTNSIGNIANNQMNNLASQYAAYGGRLFQDGGDQPIFNPFSRQWTRQGRPLKMTYDKPWGSTVYTKDGFAVNYDKNNHEIGRTKGTQTPSIQDKKGRRNVEEQAYFDLDKELSDSVKTISKRYGLNPNMVASRIAREGIDEAIKAYNLTGDLASKYPIFLGKYWGLDDFHSDSQSGYLNIREPWFNYKDAEFNNEHGTLKHTGNFGNAGDMISATAAELEYRRNEMKKKYPHLNEEQLDAAGLGAFHRGVPGFNAYVKRKGMDKALREYKPFINLKADGGMLSTNGSDFSNGISHVNNGGTHEANPQQGVPMGIAPDGLPNLVEQGEVIFDDYVYSNRLRVPKVLRDKYKLKKDVTFADAAKKISKEADERPNDPISKAGLEASLGDLRDSQEEVRNKKIVKQKILDQLNADPNSFQQAIAQQQVPQEMPQEAPLFGACGGHLKNGNDYTQYLQKSEDTQEEEVPYYLRPTEPISFIDTPWQPAVRKQVTEGATTEDTRTKVPKYKTWMRYAPVVGSTIGLGLSYLPLDYSNAERVEKAAATNTGYDTVSYNPVGNYLAYRPDDINYIANQLNASGQATARNILNTSGGNRGTAMAGLLANDYANQLALGDAYRKSMLANREQQQRVEDFNRATNMANSEGFLKAAMANQSARAQSQGQYLSAIETAAKMRQMQRDAQDESRTASLTNLFNSIGDIGRENMSFNMVNTNRSQFYGIDRNGNVFFKPAAYDSNGNIKSEALAELQGNTKNKKSKNKKTKNKNNSKEEGE